MLTFHRIPYLRFIEAPDGGEGTGGSSDADTTSPTEGGDSSGNPAWAGLRSEVDDLTWSRVEPHLKKADQEAQRRITSTNEAYKPWKQFADQGVAPERVQAALSLAQQLDSSPEGVYQYLGEFLQQNGRLPSNAEVKAADAAGEIDGEEEEPQQLFDPRVDQIQDFIQQQANAQVMREAEDALDQETNALKEAHPELTEEDVQEIITRTAFAAQRNAAAGKREIPSLEDGFKQFDALRTRILTAPRPGDSAPRLLPTSGGLPSAGPQKTYGQLSDQESQNMLASYLESQKSR